MTVFSRAQNLNPSQDDQRSRRDFLYGCTAVGMALFTGCKPEEKTIPPLCVPDEYSTIEEAIRAAQRVDISVRPSVLLKKGTYHLTAPIVIRGAITIRGESLQTIIESTHNVIFHFDTKQDCELENLNLRSIATAPPLDSFESQAPEAVIMISAGSPQIHSCVITSKMGNGLSIYGVGSSIQCSRCQIENVGSKGIFISNYATGAFSEVQVIASAYIGVLLMNNANPEFTYCVFKNGRGNGLDARSQSRGRFSSCRFVGNAISGVEISDQANPDISGSDICDNEQWGVYIFNRGLGLFTHCFLLNNGRGPFQNSTGNVSGVRFDQCITDISQLSSDEKRLHDEQSAKMENGILPKDAHGDEKKGEAQ